MYALNQYSVLDTSFSNTQDILYIDDENYDIVEVKTVKKSPKHHSINDIDKSVYDVPKPKMSRMIRKSQSTFNLNIRTSEKKLGFKKTNCQPPLPSPRKVHLNESQHCAPPCPMALPMSLHMSLQPSLLQCMQS